MNALPWGKAAILAGRYEPSSLALCPAITTMKAMTNGNGNPITFLGRTNFRNQHKIFGIRQADRRAHLYVIGKTGTGKSTLLETMIRQDIEAGRGLALFDPHGDLVERVITSAKEKRKDDLIYFNVPDARLPLGFNPLESVPITKRAVAASGML